MQVDPNDFTVKPSDKIEIRQCFFTDEIAQEYADKNVRSFGSITCLRFARFCSLVTSDQLTIEIWIHQRSFLLLCEPYFSKVEARVKEDMEQQQRWHQIMRPRASMFKFRLPYYPGVTTYLKVTCCSLLILEELQGDMFLPVWGRAQTSETRLIVTGSEQVTL